MSSNPSKDQLQQAIGSHCSILASAQAEISKKPSKTERWVQLKKGTLVFALDTKTMFTWMFLVENFFPTFSYKVEAGFAFQKGSKPGLYTFDLKTASFGFLFQTEDEAEVFCEKVSNGAGGVPPPVPPKKSKTKAMTMTKKDIGGFTNFVHEAHLGLNMETQAYEVSGSNIPEQWTSSLGPVQAELAQKLKRDRPRTVSEPPPASSAAFVKARPSPSFNFGGGRPDDPDSMVNP